MRELFLFFIMLMLAMIAVKLTDINHTLQLLIK